jgi:hypothetical protein
MKQFSYRVKLRDMDSDETQTITIMQHTPVVTLYAMQQIVNSLEELDFDYPQVVSFYSESPLYKLP